MIRNTCLFLFIFLLFSCGSKTTVILLPDKDGTTGEVIVTSKSSTILLKEPYTYTKIKDDSSNLSKKSVGQAKIKNEYQTLLGAEPMEPVYFILYFKHNSTTLTTESLSLIPKILQTAKEREPSAINIIGHTDSKGKKEYNNNLALKRAKIVGKIIQSYDVTIKYLIIESHGENDPIVITEDNISEIKNRRVEVMVR